MSKGSRTNLDIRRLTSLVSHLSPCCSYTEWFQAGSVIYTLTEGSDEGFDLFDAWSSRGGSQYKGSRAVARQWDSYAKYRGDKRHGIPTLRRLLADNGESFDALLRKANGDLGGLA
jgi:hypothetical protein